MNLLQTTNHPIMERAVDSAYSWIDDGCPNCSPSQLSVASISQSKAQPVISNINLTGDQNTINQYYANQEKMNTQGSSIDLFRAMPLSGATTICDHLLGQSGYKPSKPGDANNLLLFQDYLDSLVYSPFFTLLHTDYVDLRRTDDNANELLTQISDLFEVQQREKMRKETVILANSAFSHVGAKQTKMTLSQNTFELNPNMIKFKAYYSSMTLFAEKDGKSKVLESSLTINRIDMGFRLDLWPIVYERVYNELIVKGVDDFFAQLKTEKGPNPVKTCLK